jgi:peptidoglycan/LPS O-acetylase OafA/YrhL
MGLIRLLLAISVVVVHSTPIFGLNLVGGESAVESFYIISGFYMSLILNEKYVTQKHAFLLFISNRFLRLFPVYWAVFGLTVLFWICIGHHASAAPEADSLGMFITYFHSMSAGSILFLIFTNVCLFFQDAVMFMGLNTGTGHLFFAPDWKTTHPVLFLFLFVPQAWTLGLELLFYLIAPLLVRRRLMVVLACITFSGGIRIILYLKGLHHDPWTYRFFPSEIIFFLLGNVSYRIYKKIQTLQLKPVLLNMPWVAVVCGILLFSTVDFHFKKALFYGSFCICLPFIFERTKRLRFDGFVGDLSYPVYLNHVLLISMFGYFGFSTSRWLGLILAGASILFALILNELIANPIERFRQRRVRATEASNGVKQRVELDKGQ